MSTILDMLARHAAEWRQTARDHGIALEQARPHVDEAAAAEAATLAAVQDLEAQLAALQDRLSAARQAHKDAAARHGQALVLAATCEADGQQAADIADHLDALAAQHRDGQQPPPPPPPAQALASAGPPTPAEALRDAAERAPHDHDPDDPPPLDTTDAPADPAAEWSAAHPIGTPVRYWPATRDGASHVSRVRTPAWLLGGRLVASVDGYSGGIDVTHIEAIDETVDGALVATGGPTTTGPLAPAPVDPVVTMPDLGVNVPAEPVAEQPAEATGEPRHAKPKKQRRPGEWSGAFKAITGRLADPDGVA